MSSHPALWLTSKNGTFELGPAPDTQPGPNDIAVRARAVAINPVDRFIGPLGGLAFSWLKYPIVLGTDVAGEVVAVGSDVTRFRVGDRVLGHAASIQKGHGAAEGAFQERVILQAHMSAPIPETLSFEAASVLPLGLSTAACALFQKDLLALRHPPHPPVSPATTLLVWGGSTSVGSNAIQLAVAAGYDVVATASPRNFAYVTRLGARLAFDYNSPTAVPDIIAALRGRTLAGALAIGLGSTSACLDILGACTGNRFVAVASPPVSFEPLIAGGSKLVHMPPILARMAATTAWLALKARRHHARTKFFTGGQLMDNEVGPLIYADFLPRALAVGSFVASPEPLLVGEGLAAIPAAIARLGQGVSARKIVASLP